MARTDDHLDAMLRHLGAAYYESLHGRAAHSDVTRALDTVEEHLNEHTSRSGPARSQPKLHPLHEDGTPRKRRWARRVADVMTTSVVTVDRITPYQEIDRLLTAHKINGVPVLMMGRKVAGVVSETDLLAAEDETARRARMAAVEGRHWHLRNQPHTSLTAGSLMTSPAVTISPEATIPTAARLMNTHHIRRLPVVDDQGELVGIVSPRDLLGVFLRPDEDISHDVRQVLGEISLADSKDVTAAVRHGVVTLTGAAEPASDPHRDLVPLAVRMIWDIDGVVDVVNQLGKSKGPKPARTA